jgi:hypothetical protein
VTGADDLVAALRISLHLAARLRAALVMLEPYRPFDAASVEAVENADPLLTDAFLKRFENLVNQLQDQLWRRVAVEIGLRDPAEMSRRDLVDLMERLGLVPSADDFVDVVRTRNRLAHTYPDDPARQAARLNEACDRSATLLAAADAASAWAATRRLTPPASP